VPPTPTPSKHQPSTTTKGNDLEPSHQSNRSESNQTKPNRTMAPPNSASSSSSSSLWSPDHLRKLQARGDVSNDDDAQGGASRRFAQARKGRRRRRRQRRRRGRIVRTSSSSAAPQQLQQGQAASEPRQRRAPVLGLHLRPDQPRRQRSVGFVGCHNEDPKNDPAVVAALYVDCLADGQRRLRR
jgi:hypothetical protein